MIKKKKKRVLLWFGLETGQAIALYNMGLISWIMSKKLIVLFHQYMKNFNTQLLSVSWIILIVHLDVSHIKIS